VTHVREGIFAHEVLSGIHYKEDLDTVLRTYVLEGSITKKEKDDIERRIQVVLNNSRYAPYFEKGRKILSEKDIMLSNGSQTQIFRPDRLVEMEDGWVIIDFKTGEEKEIYADQVNNYKEILQRLGWKISGTEIIYI